MGKLFFILVFLCLWLNSYSEKIPVEIAATVATNWYRHYAPAGKADGSIIKTKGYAYKDSTNFYIFSFDKGGFVMVSANDIAEPVLGYAYDSEVRETIDHPAVKGWLDSYAHQIDTAAVLNLKSAALSLKWYQLKNNIFQKAANLSVGPLVNTRWDQGCYYNALCPVDSASTACKKVYVGCVATAYAQIMKYWSYPAKGTGSHSYTWAPYGTLAANFGNTTYNWANMPNSISSDNADIATLMYQCGVAVDMMYSPDGSGAYDPMYALPNYFGYSSKIKYIFKYSYSSLDWENILKNELDSLRPIWYRGQNKTSGHAFVCDGYQNTNYFHFNWGWSGALDGYFSLSTLAPGGTSFADVQGAIIRIFPAEGVATLPATDVGPKSAILHGTVNPSGLSTTVTFEYGATVSYGKSISAIQSPLTGNSPLPADATLTGLPPNTTYHYRIKAVNTGGTYYGSDLTFSTSSDVWTLQTSGTTNNLRSVSFVNSTTGYICGDQGTILKTVNGGSTWTSLSSGVTNNLNGIFFISETTGWAVGSAGKLLKTTDGGATWTGQTIASGSNLYCVFFTDLNTGWVGSVAKILNTTDGGTTWGSKSTSSGSPQVYSVYCTSATQGYAAGWYNNMIYLSNGNWYGSTTTPSSSGFYGVHFAGSTNGLACGAAGKIYKYVASNNSWTGQTTGVTNDLKSIFLVDSQTAYAVGSSGIILTTSNGGTIWSPSISPTSSQLNSVCFTDSRNGWAVGNTGVILHTLPSLNVRATVFLEGAYNNTSLMKTTLKTNSYLQVSQPYNVAPWNYTGTETVASIPANVVDWVLVELRQATAPNLATASNRIGTRAAFLKSDGSIVDLDGASSVLFKNCAVAGGNNLYIVIRHRNHLAVMAAAGATLSGTEYTYNFSTALTQAYGAGVGFKQVGTGVNTKCALVSGDVDYDGSIFVSDYNLWATGFGALSGYYLYDLDMDGNVYVSDYNLWAVNFGALGNELKSAKIKQNYKSCVP